jgi:putative glutamine amidotransferase
MSCILVNCDFDEKPSPRAFLYRSYADSVLRAGGLPIMMPVLKKKDTIRSLLKNVGGVLLSGGDDPNPARYGEKLLPATRLMNPDKEECDFILASEALRSRKPIFGICWGLQLINLVAGGTLIQDIPSQVGMTVTHKLPRRQSAYHKIEVVEDSLMGRLLRSTREDNGLTGAPPPTRKEGPVQGTCGATQRTSHAARKGTELTVTVNSFHHQAVKDVGRGLRKVALAGDGVIEALEGGSDRFLLGVQWHPERMPDDPFARRLFQAFVRASTRG